MSAIPRCSRGAVARLVVVGALFFAAPAFTAVRGSAFVDRVTAPSRVSVSCYDRADWARLVLSGHPELRGRESEVYGLWRYDIREVALPVRGCVALERWRRTPARVLSLWLFVLGHELTHVEQTDWYDAPLGRPFDEKEANCGGLAKFRRLRAQLGIGRRLAPPSRDLVGCPLKRARPRR